MAVQPGTEPGEIHLPPNSFIPIFIAISLTLTFIGFLDGVRSFVGPAVWIAGVTMLLVTCAVWLKAARSEYRDLPEAGSH